MQKPDTEARRAAELQARLAAIVESSDDAIVSKSLDGRILSWNRGAERIFGYTPEEAIGRSIKLIIPPDRLSEEDEILARIRRGDRIDHFETKRVHKDGRLLDISLTISPVRDASGQIIGASKIARDITARRAAEAERERLQAAELSARKAAERASRRYADLVNDLEAIVWEADPATWKFSFVSQRAREILGYDVEDWLADPGFWANLVHPDDRDAAVRLCREACETGADHDFEYRAVTADGRVLWLRDIVHVVADELGRPAQLRGIMIDITRNKELEANLQRQKEQLLEADRRKDEFLATLAHELRNPLSSIRTGLEVLQLSGSDPGILAEVHGTMTRQTEQLVRLVDDSLDIARIATGKVNLRKEPIDVCMAIRAAVDSTRPLMEERSHELTLDLPGDPIMVHADFVRVAQVFSNLLTNAAKYTPPGGRISVNAVVVEGEVVARIRDNGIGIPAEMQERIFEMFAQLRARDGQPSPTGLGVGLALVRRLVEMHGGRVSANSRGSGRGSEFVVRLPLLPEGELCDRNEVPTAGHASGKLRILIVDDNQDAARMLTLAVRALGNPVTTARDGCEALEIAELFQPDIVLMDIGMPKMNGYDAARHMRERWRDRFTLVALSGWGQEADKQRSKEAGFNYHLVKPVGLPRLQELIAAVEQKLT